MNLYVIRRRQGWRTPEELAQAAEVSSRIGNEEMSDQVRWIRTYVVREPDGQLGTLCVYQATDPEAIRDHAERVGMPSDEIAPVFDTVLVPPDPPRIAAVA